MYVDLRDVGLEWIAICACLDDWSRHSGKSISATKWAQENHFISKRWLDDHAKFAREWEFFTECWYWTSEKGYSPERRPSLRAAMDLMILERRDAVHQSAIVRLRTVVRAVPAEEQPVIDEKTMITPTATILCGDVVAMARKHIRDGQLDMIVADPPYNMQTPAEPSDVDRYYIQHNMKARFRASRDNFPDVEAAGFLLASSTETDTRKNYAVGRGVTS